MRRRAWILLLLTASLLAPGLPRPALAAACAAPDWQRTVEESDAAVLATVQSVTDEGQTDLVRISLHRILKADGNLPDRFYRPKDAPPLYPGGTYALALTRVAGNNFLLPACAAAWPVPEPVLSIPEAPASVAHLKQVGILSGDGGPLRLELTVTRAELVTLLVRAARREDEAAGRRGEATWPDLQGHWASGLVAVAREMGLVRGVSAGAFAPDRPATVAEAVTMINRFLGLRVPADQPWPQGDLAVAAEMGLPLPDARQVGDAVNRGTLFALLDTAFLTVPTPGGTVYQRLVQPRPLQVAVTAVTPGPDGLRVEGEAPGADAVFVNGRPATLTPDRHFVQTGAQAPVLVLAVDWTGRQAVWTQPAAGE